MVLNVLNRIAVNTKELYPCPFCNSRNISESDRRSCAIYCDDCPGCNRRFG